MYYDDGGKETLQLSMQTVRWGPVPAPGARERMLKLVAEETERAKNEKGKKKSGGGGGEEEEEEAAAVGEADRAAASQPAATTTSGSRATRAALVAVAQGARVDGQVPGRRRQVALRGPPRRGIRIVRRARGKVRIERERERGVARAAGHGPRFPPRYDVWARRRRSPNRC